MKWFVLCLMVAVAAIVITGCPAQSMAQCQGGICPVPYPTQVYCGNEGISPIQKPVQKSVLQPTQKSGPCCGPIQKVIVEPSHVTVQKVRIRTPRRCIRTRHVGVVYQPAVGVSVGVGSCVGVRVRCR